MPTQTGVLSAVHKGLDRLENACAAFPFRLAIFCVLALVLTWPLLGTAGAMNLFRDAQVLDAYEHHAVLAVRRFGQLPLWDPYYCGGMYSIGSAQSRHVSPTFLLSVIFGHDRAAPLIALAMIVIGLEGAWRYAVSRGASALGALLAAPVFAASGVFATAPQLGWINFFGFELMPWAAFGVRRGLRERLAAGAFVAISLAWIVGFGGTYAGPLVALLCVYETLEAIAEQYRNPRALPGLLGRAALFASLALALSLLRLLPITESLLAAPRVIGDRPGISWTLAYEALTGELGFRGNEISSLKGFFQIGAWVIPAVIAGLFGLRAIPVALLGAAAMWTATGYAAGWSPFVALRGLPLFSTLRYPERYLIIVALAACALAALGITHAQRLARRHLAGLPLLIALALLLGWNFKTLAASHHVTADHRTLSAPPEQLDREFHQARGNRWLAAHYAYMSRGSLSCWEAWPVPQSPLLRGDLPNEEYLADASAGSVRRVSWSPNRIDLDVDLQRAARVRINQNWHGGWRASVGTVVNEDGLLTLDLPAGHHQVRLRFVPRSTIAGGLGSVAALAAIAWIAWRWRKRGDIPRGTSDMRQLAIAAAAPWVLCTLAWSAIPEKSSPYGSVRGPLGNLVVADELPAGAQPLDARFANGAVLRAARLEKPKVRRGELATIELIWERTDGIPKSAAVFVHVTGPGFAFNLDHRDLSSTLPLSRLPKGKLGRDVFTWQVPPQLEPGGYEIRTGLWNAGSDERRVPVTDAGQAPVLDNAIRAMTLEVE